MDKEEYSKMFEMENTHWWFVGKRLMIISMLKRIPGYDKDRKDLKILDLGCGTGALINRLKEYGAVVGLDFSKDALEFCVARECGLLCCGDIQKKIPFGDESFDLVIASDVLEHLEDDMFTVQEIYRICKKNGFVLITVPAHQFLWSEHDVALHHRRRYRKSDLLNKVTASGFKIEKKSYTNSFILPFLAIFRLTKRISAGSSNSGKRSDCYINFPFFINIFLISIMKLECNLLKIINLPFGSSVVCFARK